MQECISNVLNPGEKQENTKTVIKESIGKNKQVRICFSYFDSGIGSIFRGLIPFDVLIRPKLDLEKVSDEMKVVPD